jgi:hypothetical protein
MNRCPDCENHNVPCVYEMPMLVEVYAVIGSTRITRFFTDHAFAIDYIDGLPDDAAFDILEHDMFTGKSIEL